MIPSDPRERFTLFLPLVAGNEAAAELLVSVGEMVRAADDLADGEADDPQEAAARVLLLALVTIPQNPFYDANREHLQELLGAMVVSWQVSNRFHRSGDQPRQEFGFVLRESPDLFMLHVCALCRGWHVAADIYEEIWGLAHGDKGETVETWAEEAA